MTVKSQTWKRAKVDFVTDLTYAQKMTKSGRDIYKIVADADFAEALERQGLEVVCTDGAFKVGSEGKVLCLPHGQLAGQHIYYASKYTLDTKLDASIAHSKHKDSRWGGLGAVTPAVNTRLPI